MSARLLMACALALVGAAVSSPATAARSPPGAAAIRAAHPARRASVIVPS